MSLWRASLKLVLVTLVLVQLVGRGAFAQEWGMDGTKAGSEPGEHQVDDSSVACEFKDGKCGCPKGTREWGSLCRECTDRTKCLAVQGCELSPTHPTP